MMRPVQTLKRFHLTVDAVEQDKLSSRLLKVHHQGKALDTMEALKTKSEGFLSQVRYLEDALAAIEQDEVRQAIVLRSIEPETDEQRVNYYEVLLQQNGETQLERKSYHRESGETESVDFTFTDRLLERLGKDLEILGGNEA